MRDGVLYTQVYRSCGYLKFEICYTGGCVHFLIINPHHHHHHDDHDDNNDNDDDDDHDDSQVVGVGTRLSQCHDMQLS